MDSYFNYNFYNFFLIINLFRLIIIVSLIFRTLITISSNSWLIAWIGLEINLISFIPLIFKKNNLLSIEARLIYFLTHIFASSFFFLMIFIIIIHNKFNFFLNNYYLFIIIPLIIKIRAAPLHFWFPIIINKINWINRLLLITWQKLAPIILLNYCLSFFINFISIISIIIGTIIRFNQTILKKILAFSSINQIGWILISLSINSLIWKIYFFLYSLFLIIIILFLNKLNLYNINQLFRFNFNLKKIKLNLIIIFLSLRGLPPLWGFFPKWLIIQNLITINNNILCIFLIYSTIIIIYVYIRLILSSLFLNLFNFKTFKYFKKYKINFILIINFLIINYTGLLIIIINYYYYTFNFKLNKLLTFNVKINFINYLYL